MTLQCQDLRLAHMNNKIKIETSNKNMSDIEATYIMALGAAKADNVLDKLEIDEIKSISEIFNHNEYFEYAFDYFEAFNNNDKAINGAIQVLKNSTESSKMSAILFMKYILQIDGMNEDESSFFLKVSKELTK
jgi:hypothetical protein